MFSTMTDHLMRALALLSAATAASAQYPCISSTTAPVSRDNYMAVFGTLDNNTIWAKEHLDDWIPKAGFEMIQEDVYKCPSVSSYAGHQADIVYLRPNGNINYKSYRYTRTSENWYPSRKGSENLGGNFEELVSAALKPRGAEKPDGLVVVGQDREDRSYRVKFRSQGRWYPSREKWEDLGGSFVSGPAVASSSRYTAVAGTDRDGTIRLKLQVGDQDQENVSEERELPWSRWIHIDAQDGQFASSPILTSRERTEQSGQANMFDLWAVNQRGRLIHVPLDVDVLVRYHQPLIDQRDLGGQFVETPKVAYNGEDIYYLVGLSYQEEVNRYVLKGYDANERSEDEGDWWPLAGPFMSEPSILTTATTANQKQSDALYIYGIDTDGVVRMQIWNGQEVLPSVDRGKKLGRLPNPDEGRRPSTQWPLEL